MAFESDSSTNVLISLFCAYSLLLCCLNLVYMVRSLCPASICICFAHDWSEGVYTLLFAACMWIMMNRTTKNASNLHLRGVACLLWVFGTAVRNNVFQRGRRGATQTSSLVLRAGYKTSLESGTVLIHQDCSIRYIHNLHFCGGVLLGASISSTALVNTLRVRAMIDLEMLHRLLQKLARRRRSHHIHHS